MWSRSGAIALHFYYTKWRHVPKDGNSQGKAWSIRSLLSRTSLLKAIFISSFKHTGTSSITLYNRSVTLYNTFRPHLCIVQTQLAIHITLPSGNSPVIYMETFHAVSTNKGFSTEHFELNKTIQDVIRHRQRKPKIIYI